MFKSRQTQPFVHPGFARTYRPGCIANEASLINNQPEMLTSGILDQNAVLDDCLLITGVVIAVIIRALIRSPNSLCHCSRLQAIGGAGLSKALRYA